MASLEALDEVYPEGRSNRLQIQWVLEVYTAGMALMSSWAKCSHNPTPKTCFTALQKTVKPLKDLKPRTDCGDSTASEMLKATLSHQT